MRKQKIVTIGGGTGQYELLRGLCEHSDKLDITAIVNTCDNGGSSGVLRREKGIIPPGDILGAILGLTPKHLEKGCRVILKHRPDYINNHTTGNVIFEGLVKGYGGTMNAIKFLCERCNCVGKILPVTLDDFSLQAVIRQPFSGGFINKIIRGQKEISYLTSLNDDKLKISSRILKLSSKRECQAYWEVINAIKSADKIVICPGDLYGSIIPNFLVSGIKETLEKSKAKKIYVCNLFTKEGNYNFRVSDFVNEIEKYSGIKLNKILVNSVVPTKEVLKKYLKENSKFVEDNLGKDSRVVRGDFVVVKPHEEKTLFRHSAEKVTCAILKL